MQTTARSGGRTRADIETMSRAGLPLEDFLDELTRMLRVAVPFVAACTTTFDPATSLATGARKHLALAGRNEGDLAWARIEYGEEDETAYRRMLTTATRALGVSQTTQRTGRRSPRMTEVIEPLFGFGDEARTLGSDRNGPWGAIALFREQDAPAFTTSEIAFLGGIAPAITRGIRAGLISQTIQEPAADVTGPAVVVIDARDRIVLSSAGGDEELARLAARPGMGDPLLLIQSLVTGARRFARGEDAALPRIRLRAPDGGWRVLHAAALAARDGHAGEVAVTIEHARPPEVIDLVASAFGLTERERAVVAQVLRGLDTKQIAAALFVSPYTVQDHLKAVFDKMGVTSRRELVALVYFDTYAYFDKYAPSRGRTLSPDGGFAPALQGRIRSQV